MLLLTVREVRDHDYSWFMITIMIWNLGVLESQSNTPPCQTFDFGLWQNVPVAEQSQTQTQTWTWKWLGLETQVCCATQEKSWTSGWLNTEHWILDRNEIRLVKISTCDLWLLTNVQLNRRILILCNCNWILGLCFDLQSLSSSNQWVSATIGSGAVQCRHTTTQRIQVGFNGFSDSSLLLFFRFSSGRRGQSCAIHGPQILSCTEALQVEVAEVQHLQHWRSIDITYYIYV